MTAIERRSFSLNPESFKPTLRRSHSADSFFQHTFTIPQIVIPLEAAPPLQGRVTTVAEKATLLSPGGFSKDYLAKLAQETRPPDK